MSASPGQHTLDGGGGGHERLLVVQRTRLLAATIGVAAEHGLNNLTIGDVAARSGASRRTFYEHFRDLEKCVEAAFGDAFARAEQEVRFAYQSERRWSERVHDALAALLRFIEFEPAAGRFLLVESLAAGPAVLERRREALVAIAAELDSAGNRARGNARGELPPLVGEGVVGGVLGVLHTRLLAPQTRSLLDLTNQLAAMVVLPYLGPSAARRELGRPTPRAPQPNAAAYGDMLSGLGMRLTYRTVRVLTALADTPGASNRTLAAAAGIADQGQISKLLARLQRLGLIANTSPKIRGERNAWQLTAHGQTIHSAINARADG